MITLKPVTASPAMNKKTNLIWIDLEMTGLVPEKDNIIEIATVVTDAELNVIAEGPSLAIHQDNKYLDSMDKWNTHQHTKSCLLYTSPSPRDQRGSRMPSSA